MLTGITYTPKGDTALCRYKLVVEGDTNDGDYITEVTTFNEQELIKYLPVIHLIGDQIRCWGERRYDSYYTDAYTPTEIEEDLLSDLIPYGEYGVHSVNISSFEYTDEHGKIYDIKVDFDTFKQAHPELFI